jgi:hypothetical protein
MSGEFQNLQEKERVFIIKTSDLNEESYHSKGLEKVIKSNL